MKRFLQNMILLSVTLLLIALLLEVFFRVLPVNTGLGIQPVSKNDPYFKAAPNTEFVYSLNWNLQIPNKGHINNQGFIHEQDYDSTEQSPLMAVFGDSYVEALMVPFQESLTGRLHNSFNGKARAYSFAFSGAPLSQYLAWAEHARDSYKPDAATFVIIGNDFDESLMKYKSAGGFHYLIEKNNGLELSLVDYQIGPFRPIIKKSALLRYLALNLKVQQLPSQISRLFNQDHQTQAFENNVISHVSSERLEDSKQAVLFFLENVVKYSGVPKEKIIFVVDGLRDQIYAGQVTNTESYVAQMFRYFISEARHRGFSVIDMHKEFEADYRITQKRFEFDVDAHWSGYGHQIVSKAVMKHPIYQYIKDKSEQ